MRKKSRNESESKHTSKLYSCIFGALFGAIMAVALAIVAAALIHFSGLPDVAITVAGYLCVVIGGFFCGKSAAQKSGNRGLICGLMAGILYSIILYLSGGAVTGNLSAVLHMPLVAVAAILPSLIGGIMGVGK